MGHAPVLGRGELGDRAGTIARIRGAVSQVVIGHGEALDQLLVGLLGRGHALVEDVPGVGKTMLAGRGRRCWAASSVGFSSHRTCSPSGTAPRRRRGPSGRLGHRRLGQHRSRSAPVPARPGRRSHRRPWPGGLRDAAGAPEPGLRRHRGRRPVRAAGDNHRLRAGAVRARPDSDEGVARAARDAEVLVTALLENLGGKL